MSPAILPVRGRRRLHRPTVTDGRSLPRRISPLQRRPHVAVALGGPDHRVIDALCLIEGARDIERQTMFVDRKGGEFRVHDGARRTEGLLERVAGGDASPDRAIKRAEKIPRHGDPLGGLGGPARRPPPPPPPPPGPAPAPAGQPPPP